MENTFVRNLIYIIVHNGKLFAKTGSIWTSEAWHSHPHLGTRCSLGGHHASYRPRRVLISRLPVVQC